MTRAATAAACLAGAGLAPGVEAAVRAPSLLPSPFLLPDPKPEPVAPLVLLLDDAGSESDRPRVDAPFDRPLAPKSGSSFPPSTGETGAEECPSLDPGTRTAAGLPDPFCPRPAAALEPSWLVCGLVRACIVSAPGTQSSPSPSYAPAALSCAMSLLVLASSRDCARLASAG